MAKSQWPVVMDKLSSSVGVCVSFYVDHTKGQVGVSPFGFELSFVQSEGKEDGESFGV